MLRGDGILRKNGGFLRKKQGWLGLKWQSLTEKGKQLWDRQPGLRSAGLWVLYAGSGLLAAKGAVFGAFAPFGVSLCAVVPFPFVLATFGGALAGYGVFPAVSGSFRYIAAMSAVLAIRWTLCDIRRLSRHPLFSVAVSAVPVFATGLAMMTASGWNGRMAGLYGLEALLSGGGAYFLSRTLTILRGTKSLGMLMPQETACLVVTGCLGALGLSGVGIAGLSLGRIIAAAVVLFAARFGGAAGGTVAGVALGMVLGMSSSDTAFLGTAYPFGGLMAGLFAPVGPAAGAIAFVLGTASGALLTGDAEPVLRCTVECLAGGALFFLLPDDGGVWFRELFLRGDPAEEREGLLRSVTMRLRIASRALAGVSSSVEEVSERLTELVTPTMEEVYRQAVEDACCRCGMRVFCWEHRDGMSMSSFDRLTQPLRQQGWVTKEDFREDFLQKCCRPAEMAEAVNRCYGSFMASQAAEKRMEEVRQVVAGQFCGLGDILGEMAQEYENYERFDRELGQRITVKMKELGLKPLSVSCRVDASGRMTVEAETEICSPKHIRRAMLTHEIGRICKRRFEAPGIATTPVSCRISLCEQACYDVETASSQHICGNGRLCGDSLTYFTDGGGHFDVIVSDGMGTGGRAAVDGGMASGIMERLVKAGLGFDCSLKVVNSALLVKSGDESLATLDVLSIDLYSGRANFMKAGAALTFLRKGNTVTRVETPSLPAGILPDIGFSRTEEDLMEGDVIVMVSDGAIATGEDWIERMIAGFRDDSMQTLADRILDEAQARRSDGHDDDITVIAMRLSQQRRWTP